MNIELAPLADYAGVMADGKLMVAGVFDTLSVPVLPATPPIIYLALRIAGDGGEVGKHQLELRFVDPDGTPIVPVLHGEFDLEDLQSEGGTARVQFVMGMAGVAFSKLGPHALDILLDGRYEMSVPVDVQQVAPPGR